MAPPLPVSLSLVGVTALLVGLWYVLGAGAAADTAFTTAVGAGLGVGLSYAVYDWLRGRS
jgi:hypothetical protein